MNIRQLVGERASRRRRGVIVGGVIVLSSLTGGIWADGGGGSTPQANACQPVFAGRAGMLPCPPPNTAFDDRMDQLIGSTAMGTLIGGIFGGPPGMLAGFVGTAVSNFRW
jgi:hypothetical protein